MMPVHMCKVALWLLPGCSGVPKQRTSMHVRSSPCLMARFQLVASGGVWPKCSSEAGAGRSSLRGAPWTSLCMCQVAHAPSQGCDACPGMTHTLALPLSLSDSGEIFSGTQAGNFFIILGCKHTHIYPEVSPIYYLKLSIYCSLLKVQICT